MPRGRSIDRTLQPSRALTQQRDYRARKAARIEHLEEQVERLQAENERLRAELNNARAGRGTASVSNATAPREAAAAVRRGLLLALQAVDQLDGGGAGISGGAGPSAQPSAPVSSRAVGLPLYGIDERESSPLPEPLTRIQASTCRAVSLDPPVPVPMIATYDEACCAGIFDCSHLPPLAESDIGDGHHGMAPEQEARGAASEPDPKPDIRTSCRLAGASVSHCRSSTSGG